MLAAGHKQKVPCLHKRHRQMFYVHKVGAYHQRDKLSVRHASLPDTSSTSDGQIGLLTPCSGQQRQAKRRAHKSKA